VIASVHDAGSQVNADGISGFNVDIDNRNELCDALVKLLGDHGLRTKMAAAAYQRWNDYFRFRAFKDRLIGILKENQFL